MTAWAEHLAREEARFAELDAARPDEDADARQRRLTRLGNAAWGAGLALLMQGRRGEAAEWLGRAADLYRGSFADAPPGSWGRLIGTAKARALAGDLAGAEEAARWSLAQGPAEAESPIGRYAACLALLVLGRDGEARALADSLRNRDDFPRDVAEALAALAAGDRAAYAAAVESVLRSFETREEYLEEIPAADTVLVLQGLAERRGLAVPLASPLLPAG